MASFFIMRMRPFDLMTIDMFDPQPSLFMSRAGWLKARVQFRESSLLQRNSAAAIGCLCFRGSTKYPSHMLAVQPHSQILSLLGEEVKS